MTHFSILHNSLADRIHQAMEIGEWYTRRDIEQLINYKGVDNGSDVTNVLHQLASIRLVELDPDNNAYLWKRIK